MTVTVGGFIGARPAVTRRSASGVWTLDEQQQLRDQGEWGKYPFDIARARYYGKSLVITAEEPVPSALYIKPDGTKLYTLGTNQDSVDQYTMATPWDVSTASYDGVTRVVGGATGTETAPSAMHFSPDGTRMYILGSAIDTIEQYSLSTPWVVSSAVKVGQSGGQEASPFALYIKPDGTKAYTIGTANTIYRYSFGTPWDVTTLAYDGVNGGSSGSLATQINGFATGYGLAFKPDGTKVFVTDITTDSIHELALAAPWETSAATYTGTSVQTTSLVSTGQNPTGLNISPDGLNLYFIHISTDTIFQLEMY